MATWNDLPAEIRVAIMEYLLFNRKISKRCTQSMCLVCPYMYRQSDLLSIQLVSKDFISAQEAARILFSTATLVIYHASDITPCSKLPDLVSPLGRICHLRIPGNCNPVRSKYNNSIQQLKKLFPKLHTIDIDMSCPLSFYMSQHHDVYPHAYNALRLSKVNHNHLDWPRHSPWPIPSPAQFESISKQSLLQVKTLHGEHNDVRAPHSILAFFFYLEGINHHRIRINPYLIAWHARLVHDAAVCSSIVRVNLSLKLELLLQFPRHNMRTHHTVRAQLNSTDMILTFRLNETLVLIPQVLDQPWFDSHFGHVNEDFWNYNAETRGYHANSTRRRASEVVSKRPWGKAGGDPEVDWTDGDSEASTLV